MQIKTIQDYYKQIQTLYPSIPLSDIKRILQYGYKSLYLHNSYGGDVLINRKDFWFYVGHLTSDSLKYFNYYKNKMRVKLRILYKRKKINWDGYYYFALTKNQYQNYLNQKSKRGRPRKNFIFEKIILYKIYDECYFYESNKVAIFKIPYLVDLGFSIYKEELKTDKSELILTRDPLTFQDVLLSTNKYQFISDNRNKYKNKTK